MPARVAERGSDGDGSRRGAAKNDENGGGNAEEEKTAAAVIGKFLGSLPLFKLKIVIGMYFCHLEGESIV